MIFLKNCTYIDWETLEISRTHIAVNEGIGNSIALFKKLPEPDKLRQYQVIDCQWNLVTRSLACGHHHVYSALACGMGKPKKNPQSFLDILKYIWWTLDKCLDPESIEISAYVTAIECARRGSTFVIDHHASPNAIKGSLGIIARVFDEVGINHLLCYEISDRDGVDLANKALHETESYLAQRQGLVGLHASFTLTKNTLKHGVEIAQKYKTGVHVHVAEDLYDQDNCYELYNKRVIERFEEFGIMDLKKSILVHCLYLTENERQIIRNSGIFVVQNTDSNLNNNVGFFRSHCLGPNIMLGTDGMHSDMLRSMKMAYLVGQTFDTISPTDAYNRLRNVNRYLRQNNFKGDGDNNLIVLKYNPATKMTQQNAAAHFIFAIDTDHITHVISNGKLIAQNGKILTVDEDKIKSIARKVSAELWKRMKKITYPTRKS